MSLFKTYTIQCRDTGFSGNTYKIRTMSQDVAIAKGFIGIQTLELIKAANDSKVALDQKAAVVATVEMMEKALKLGMVEPVATDDLLMFMPLMDRMLLYYCIVGVRDAAEIEKIQAEDDEAIIELGEEGKAAEALASFPDR